MPCLSRITCTGIILTKKSAIKFFSTNKINNLHFNDVSVETCLLILKEPISMKYWWNGEYQTEL